MNILVTSAGRRGYIIKFFKEVLEKYGGKVFAGNSSYLSTAFEYADESVVTPLVYDKEYIPFLLSFCKKNQIDMIISLFDVDLLILSQNKELFLKNGVQVIVSDESIIRICNDKLETYNFCQKNGIEMPQTYQKIDDARQAIVCGKLKFPVIVKPRWGMGSIGIFQADNKEELDIFVKKCKVTIENSYLKYETAVDVENSVIIQEKMDGTEFGVDVINDLQGQFSCSVVRKKYAMRAGETDCAAVVKDEKISMFAQKLGNALCHIGNLDVDIFIQNDKIYLLEMNARFGGGYPFSHLAGVNLPKAIVKWLQGEKLTDELVVKQYNQIYQKDISFVNLTRFQ